MHLQYDGLTAVLEASYPPVRDDAVNKIYYLELHIDGNTSDINASVEYGSEVYITLLEVSSRYFFGSRATTDSNSLLETPSQPIFHKKFGRKG